MTEIIKIAALTFSLLIISLLIIKKGKNKTDKVLLLWSILFGIHSITLNFPHQLGTFWFYINEVAGYFHGFFLLLYLKSSHNKSLKQAYPILASIFLLSLSPILYFGEEYWNHISSIMGMKLISNSTFILIVIRALVRRRSIKNNWIFFLTLGLILIQLVPTILAIGEYESFLNTQNLSGNISFCIFLILLGFSGIGLEPIFVAKQVERVEIKEKRPPKYSSSHLTKESRVQIFQEIDREIMTQQLYLIPDLSIRKLAEETKYQPHQISESINDILGCNFNKYINLKRIEVVKCKIDNKEHLSKTLLAIAFESGFNSKSSFNRAFKKVCALTPSQYISSKS